MSIWQPKCIKKFQNLIRRALCTSPMFQLCESRDMIKGEKLTPTNSIYKISPISLFSYNNFLHSNVEHKLGFETIKNRQSNCLIRLDFVKNVFCVYSLAGERNPRFKSGNERREMNANVCVKNVIPYLLLTPAYYSTSQRIFCC